MANSALIELAGCTVLTFRCNDRFFALPINSVNYIMSEQGNNVNLRSTDHQTRKAMDFNGQVIQIIDFSRLIGASSQVEEVRGVIELLQQRRQDHISWLDALEHSLTTDEPFSKATDPHKCAFGLWYDAFETDDDLLSDILKKFDEPHKRIHGSAETLLSLSSSGEKQEAIRRLGIERTTTLKRLLDLFDEASQRLNDMIRPVLVVLEANDQMFAIELDEVSGILECTSDEVVSSTEDIDGYVRVDHIVSAYISRDGLPMHSLIEPKKLLATVTGR